MADATYDKAAQDEATEPASTQRRAAHGSTAGPSWRPSKYLSVGGDVRANPDVVFAGSIVSATLTGLALRDAVEQHATGALIDVGCGSAPAQSWYSDRTTSYLRVDWPSGAHGSTFVDVFADVSTLPLASDTFDSAVCSDVLEHVADPGAAVAELARVLRPGAAAIVTIPFLYPLHESPHDYQRFTSFGLRRLFEQAGFDVVTLEPIGGSLDVLADLSAKHVGVVPVVGKQLARTLSKLTLWFGDTGLGRRLRRRTGPTASLGHVLVARASQS